MAIIAIAMTATATTANSINERRSDQLRKFATSLIGMDSSFARAKTAEDEVRAGDGAAGKPGMVEAQSGRAGGSFDDEAGALEGAASSTASADSGVPTAVRVLRRWDAGTMSPVPSRVANGDLCVRGRCGPATCRADIGAGESERTAGMAEGGGGVTERGAGVAKGKPLRDEGGAVMLNGATGNLTLGKVELRVGTGRC